MPLPVSFAALEWVPAETLLAETLLTEAASHNAIHIENGVVDESLIVPLIRVESLTELLGLFLNVADQLHKPGHVRRSDIRNNYIYNDVSISY